MVHQILYSRARIASHCLTGGLDEPVVSLFGAGDGLWSGYLAAVPARTSELLWRMR